MERKLTTIVAVDVAGYSRLVAADEEVTLAELSDHRTSLIDPLLDTHSGRIANTAGDSLLVEFPSAVEAVRFAVSVQDGMAERNESIPENRRIEFRAGVHVGDVMTDGQDLLGDGVNIAARLEGIAPPGEIVISRTVHDQIQDRLQLQFVDLGEVEVKNIPRPIPAFQMQRNCGTTTKIALSPQKRSKPWMAVAATIAFAVAAIGLWEFTLRPDVAPADPDAMAFPLPAKPSIAVLTFANLSGDPKQEFLADGFTEDVISSLARYPDVFVISRRSADVYDGKSVPIRQVAEELGVQFVLEGGVQREGDQLRVTARLIDALSGDHIWSRKFDREVENLFEARDDLTRDIVNGIGVNILHGDTYYSRGEGVKSLDAWLLGNESYKLDQTNKKPEMIKALALMDEALALEPGSGQLHAWTAWRYSRLAVFQYADDPAAAIASARHHAEKAIELSPDQPDGYAALAFVERMSGKPQLAIELGERSVRIAPNDAGFLALLGQYKSTGGQAEEAIELLEDATRLNPLAEHWVWDSYGEALAIAGRYQEAIKVYQITLDRGVSGFALGDVHLGMAYSNGSLGNSAAAEKHVKLALDAVPDFSVKFFEKWPSYEPEYKAKWVETLRRAGIPEN